MTVLVAIGDNEQTYDAVEVAYDLATTYDDDLVAVHVVPEEDFQAHQESVRNVPGFPNFSLEQEETSAADFARTIVNEALDEYESDRIETRGRVGDPAEELLGEVAGLDPRYFVLGGERRSPVGKAVFGSTTQRLILDADCPVVTTVSDS